MAIANLGVPLIDVLDSISLPKFHALNDRECSKLAQKMLNKIGDSLKDCQIQNTKGRILEKAEVKSRILRYLLAVALERNFYSIKQCKTMKFFAILNRARMMRFLSGGNSSVKDLVVVYLTKGKHKELFTRD